MAVMSLYPQIWVRGCHQRGWMKSGYYNPCSITLGGIIFYLFIDYPVLFSGNRALQDSLYVEAASYWETQPAWLDRHIIVHRFIVSETKYSP